MIQVFENLLENACKYGRSADGRVAVTPAAGQDGPVVTVRDFGPGIAAEHIPRLTERFYRINGDDSRKHRGTGSALRSSSTSSPATGPAWRSEAVSARGRQSV